jgi:hypothetical protein
MHLQFRDSPAALAHYYDEARQSISDSSRAGASSEGFRVVLRHSILLQFKNLDGKSHAGEQVCRGAILERAARRLRVTRIGVPSQTVMATSSRRSLLDRESD